MHEIETLRAYLDAHPAPYAKQFAQVLEQVDQQVAESQRAKTVAQRKAAWVEAVQKFDVEQLVALQERMQGYVDKIARIDTEEPRALTHDEVVKLGSEFVDFLDISEFLATRREIIKDLVFAHLDETVGPGVNGEVPVPEVGKTFKREGCGRTTPAVDVERLRELVGEDDWQDCLEVTEVPEVHIPAHTEIEFSEEKLMALCARKPEVLEHLRESLIPGKLKTPRFVPRPYKEQKEK